MRYQNLFGDELRSKKAVDLGSTAVAAWRISLMDWLAANFKINGLAPRCHNTMPCFCGPDAINRTSHD